MTCGNPHCPCNVYEEAVLPYPLDPEAQAAAEGTFSGVELDDRPWTDEEKEIIEAAWEARVAMNPDAQYERPSALGPHETAGQGSMRAFDTGATRNLDVDPDIYGFTSPLALGLFAEYMHENRVQADGSVRDSDNWKKGIPLDSYVRSMRRHMQDLTLHHDGYGELAREDLFAALGGLFFNVQGYMHEVVKQGVDLQREDVEEDPALRAFIDLWVKPAGGVTLEAEGLTGDYTITADGGEEEVDGLA